MKIAVPISYAERRRQEYPAIEEQLDILYHYGYDAWKAVIAEIKSKHPKP